MTNIINLPTYEQSEEIKTELKEMLGAIINSGGVNVSKCKPFSFQKDISINSGDTSYKNILSLDGKGYLSAAVFRGDTSNGNAVKITIDDEVVLETSTNSIQQVTGFLLRDNISLNPTGLNSFVISNINYQLPLTFATFSPGLQYSSIFVSSQFLFFEKSLRVEFRRMGSTQSNSTPYFVSGGKMK